MFYMLFLLLVVATAPTNSFHIVRSPYSHRPVTTRIFESPESPSKDPPSISSKDPPSISSTRVTSAILFTSYFMVMLAKCALPVALPAIRNPSTWPSSALSHSGVSHYVAQTLLLSTAAIALGKFSLGPLIDKFGGYNSLLSGHLLLSALFFSLSRVEKLSSFRALWIGVDFTFSAMWASGIGTISEQQMTDRQSRDQIGSLALGGRLGCTAAFLWFARMQNFRTIFLAGGVANLIPVGILLLTKTMMRRSIVNKNSATPSETSININDSLKQLKHLLRTDVEFYRVAILRSCLMVFGSFVLFVPSFFEFLFGVAGAKVGGVYSGGCLAMLLFSTKIYPKLNEERKKRVLRGSLLAGLLSALTCLATTSNIISPNRNLITFAMFGWGLSFPLAFYFPPTLYALERGSAATITDAMDFLGFIMLAFFNTAATQVSNVEGYSRLLKYLVGLILTSFFIV